METIQASKAKTHFYRILDRVEAGESVVITRHGRTIARIVPERQFSEERFRQAKAAFLELRKHIVPSTLEEILSARDEGRK